MECKIHFLNVLNGDCTIIEHETGRISVIDICNGNMKNTNLALEANFNRQSNPTNPIDYLHNICNGQSVFRFILTHPDMDHMDGIKRLFDKFSPTNFWDTDNTKDLSKSDWKKYRQGDWEFYKQIRSNDKNPKTIRLYAGFADRYYEDDGFEIISPNKKLVNELQQADNSKWNEISYVILHQAFGRKILYCGDSGNKAWQNMNER